MVRQDIVDYLREGKRRGFSVQLLKKKLLEGGFSEKDVDEAAKSIEGESTPNWQDAFKQTPQIKIQNQSAQENNLGKNKISLNDEMNKSLGKAKSSETNWTKIAGYSGILLLLAIISVGFILFFSPDVFDLIISNQIIFVVASFLVFLFLVLYYIGFARLGRKVNEGLLRIGALLIVTPSLIYIILMVVGGFVVGQQINLESSKVTLLVMGIVTVVAFLLNVVGVLLFSIGLIKTGGKVKFSKATGIIYLIIFLAGFAFVVGMIMIIYSLLNAISNPETIPSGLLSATTFFDTLAGLTSGVYVVIYSAAMIYALKIIGLVFGIMTLFRASKQLEN